MHKNVTTIGLALIIGLTSSSFSTAEDCQKQTVPTLPDAKVATEVQMQAAQSQVKAFITANNHYISCSKSMNKRKKAFREIQRVARAFNRSLKAYQERIDNQEVAAGERTAVAMQ